jgi:glutamate carboxypeptidase
MSWSLAARSTAAAAMAVAVWGVARLAGVTQGGSLSAEERSAVAYVDTHNDAAVALLERVVNINSGTMNLEGVRAVGQVFRSELDALGFKTQWVDETAVARAGHLIADHPGPGPRILLIGHLDTVFDKASPFQRFERIDAKTARGPGVMDMKGGDVIIVHALKALDAAGVLKNMNVVVVMTGDEEEPGHPRVEARAPLVAAATGAVAAIGFEDGDGDPQHAVTARRGTMSWDLRVMAKSGHSSQVFSAEIGAGAIFEAARIINAFRERLASESHLTFNPGTILGGTSVEFDPAEARGSAAGRTNVVSAEARVAGDLRALTVEQFDHARQAMQEIVAASLPNAHSVLTFDEGYPPLAPSDGNTRLLAMYDRASRDLDFGEVTAISPDKAGAADVSFVAGKAGMILDAVGLKGHDGHSPNETADLSVLPSQTKRAAVLLARLTRLTGAR